MDKTLQFLIADIEDRLAALKELVKAQQSEINRKEMQINILKAEKAGLELAVRYWETGR